MALTDAGTAWITSLVATNYSSTGYMGVGDSTTSFATTQTDLQAATNKYRKAFDATFPTVSGTVMTCQTTFGISEANFAWQEWGTFNAASSGVMLNRKVESNGTKSSGDSWQFVVTITFTD